MAIFDTSVPERSEATDNTLFAMPSNPSFTHVVDLSLEEKKSDRNQLNK